MKKQLSTFVPTLLDTIRKYGIRAEKSLTDLQNPDVIEVLHIIQHCPEINTSELVQLTNQPQPIISQIVARLKRTGLVQSEKRGKYRLHSIDYDAAAKVGRIAKELAR